MRRLSLFVFGALAFAGVARAQDGERTELWLQFIYPEERVSWVGSMANEAVCEATATALGKARAASGMKEAAVFVCRAPALEAN